MGAHGTPGRGRRGFTLLELLVAIGVIALLAVMLLGVVMGARRHARDSRCKGNLNQLWKAVNYYANNHNDILFVNLKPPLRISNVVYANQRRMGWGHLYPEFLNDNRLFYCPEDPARDLEWQDYGWRHWQTEEGEVQCSYGWRGRQDFVADPGVAFTLAAVDGSPQKALGCDYYEDFTSPPRIHHDHHINVLRCNGAVEHLTTAAVPSFGPDPEHFRAALDLIDR